MDEFTKRERKVKKPLIIGIIVVAMIILIIGILIIIGASETPSTQEVNSLIQETSTTSQRDMTLLNADVNSSPKSGQELYNQCESVMSNLNPLITKLQKDLTNSGNNQNAQFLKLELDRAILVKDFAYILPRYNYYTSAYNADSTANGAGDSSLEGLKTQIDEFLKSEELIDATNRTAEITSLISTIQQNPNMAVNYFGSSYEQEMSDSKSTNQDFMSMLSKLQTMSNNLEQWIAEAPPISNSSSNASSNVNNQVNNNSSGVMNNSGSNSTTSTSSTGNNQADSNSILELLSADQTVQGVVSGTNVNWSLDGYDGGYTLNGEEIYGGSDSQFNITISMDSNNTVTVTEKFNGQITGHYQLTKNGHNLSGTFTNASNGKVSKATFCV